jgi:hypothetical protein
MRIRRIGGMLLWAGLLTSTISCDNESNEIPRSAIRFEKTADSYIESDGTLSSFSPYHFTASTGRNISVKVILSNPATDNSEIHYKVGGTAYPATTKGSYGDYHVPETPGKILVAKGATEATITLTLYEDIYFKSFGGVTENGNEDDNGLYETIVITLTEVKSGPVIIDQQQKEITIKIYEDDTVIELDWASTQADSVDMDLFLWYDGDDIAASKQAIIDPASSGEGIFIPAGLPDGTYALSYTYAGGKSNDLAFTSHITNYGGTLTFNTTTDSELSFDGHYTLDNLNVYNDLNDPNYKGDQVEVQFLTKTGFNYTVTDLNEAASSSRVRTNRTTPEGKLLKEKDFDLMLKR